MNAPRGLGKESDHRNYAMYYAVMDSIHQLSHRPDHPWCTTPKEKLGNFLNVTRKTVHAAITDGLKKGLLEKNERGDLRTTEKWIQNVVLYETRE